MNYGFIKEDMKYPIGRIYWRILIPLCLLFYPVVLYVGIKSNKNIEFAWLKIKGIDTVRITNTVYKDTGSVVVKYLPTARSNSKPATKNEFKNTNGTNAVAGRDITGPIGKNVFSGRADSGAKIDVGDKTYNSERVLSAEELREVLKKVNKCQIRNTAPNSIIMLAEGGASPKIMMQIYDYLKVNGYNPSINGIATDTGTMEGVTVQSKHSSNHV